MFLHSHNCVLGCRLQIKWILLYKYAKHEEVTTHLHSPAQGLCIMCVFVRHKRVIRCEWPAVLSCSTFLGTFQIFLKDVCLFVYMITIIFFFTLDFVLVVSLCQ